jgi:hypothetical protein
VLSARFFKQLARAADCLIGFELIFFIAVRERLILQISRKSGNHPVTPRLLRLVLFRENLINAAIATA